MFIMFNLHHFAGCFLQTLSSTRLRIFSRPSVERTNWKLSLNECHNKGETPVTLFDEEDANFTANFARGIKVWLGLHRVGRITWSDGSPLTFSKSDVCVKDNEQKCEAVENNTWKGFDCSEKKPFMCYEGK